MAGVEVGDIVSRGVNRVWRFFFWRSLDCVFWIVEVDVERLFFGRIFSSSVENCLVVNFGVKRISFKVFLDI